MACVVPLARFCSAFAAFTLSIYRTLYIILSRKIVALIIVIDLSPSTKTVTEYIYYIYN